MKTVSTEGVVKKLKILPSKFREGSFYVILEIGNNKPLEVSGSASTQSVLVSNILTIFIFNDSHMVGILGSTEFSPLL